MQEEEQLRVRSNGWCSELNQQTPLPWIWTLVDDLGALCNGPSSMNGIKDKPADDGSRLADCTQSVCCVVDATSAAL